MDLNVHNHVLHFQYVPKHDFTLEFVSSTVDLATTMHIFDGASSKVESFLGTHYD